MNTRGAFKTSENRQWKNGRVANLHDVKDEVWSADECPRPQVAGPHGVGVGLHNVVFVMCRCRRRDRSVTSILGTVPTDTISNERYRTNNCQTAPHWIFFLNLPVFRGTRLRQYYYFSTFFSVTFCVS